MDTINITPEWVLNELPHTHYADGNGKVNLYTDSATDSRWIVLALDSLCIPYDENSYGDSYLKVYGFEFVLEDIKQECPHLYQTLMVSVIQSQSA